MVDLPTPRVPDGDADEKINVLVGYLYQLKEAVEIAIDGIWQNQSDVSLNTQIDTIMALIKASQDAITDTQAQAAGIPTKVSQLKNDAGYISAETDPTVPAWAKTEAPPAANQIDCSISGLEASNVQEALAALYALIKK